MSSLAETVDRQGYAVIPGILNAEAISRLRAALAGAGSNPAVRTRGESAYALRDLFRLVPEVRELARDAAVRNLVEPVLGPGSFPVRAILFDKTGAANWKVGWHQDLIIPVRERREVPGFSGWSIKAGTVHVHPPSAILEKMLALRLHLDNCGPENGALRVIPGSHAAGKLAEGTVREWRERVPEVTCAVGAGGALLMRPLLLHASSPAASPAHRRVLHLEFAVEALPSGLEWAEA